MVRLKKFLIFILSVYFFVLISRLPSVLIGNTVIEQLSTAISLDDLGKQKSILNSIIDNRELKKGLDKIFKGRQDESLNYLVLFDSTKMLKEYFNVQKIFDIDERQKLPILKKALAAGALQMVVDMINKGGVKVTSEMLINNFDSLARETDPKKIKNFVNAIKKIDMLRTILEERSVFDEEKDLKALIHHVAQRCNMNWLKALIKEGVCVTLEDKHKDTPFHLAVITLSPYTLDNKVEFINYMIKKKNIDILYKNRDNKTALDFAKEYLAKYKKLHTDATALLFKNLMAKKVEVYNQLVKKLGQLQRD